MPKKKNNTTKKEVTHSQVKLSFDTWDWPFAFTNNVSRDVFLDEFFGNNPSINQDERRQFIQYLYLSVSLETEEKLNVIRHFPTLVRTQFEALIDTWNEERKKFAILAEEHPKDLSILNLRRQIEWAGFIDKKYGLTRLIDYLPAETLLSDDGMIVLYELFKKAEQQDNIFAQIRLFEHLLEVFDTAKVSELSEMAKEVLKRISNNYLFIISKRFISHFNDPYFQKTISNIRKVNALTGVNMEETLNLYLFAKQGVSFYPESERETLLSQVKNFQQSISFFVIYRDIQFRNSNVLANAVTPLLLYSENLEKFEATIDEKLNTFPDEYLIHYMQFVTSFVCIFYCFKADGLSYSRLELWKIVYGIYDRLLGLIRKKPTEFQLRYAEQIKSLVYFFNSEISDNTLKAPIAGEAWSLIVSQKQNGFDPKEIVRIALSDNALDKEGIYQTCCLVYAVALQNEDRDNFEKFNSVLNNTISIFEVLHHKRGLPLEKDETTWFRSLFNTTG